MGKKIIRLGLSESEIDNAISELNQYKRTITEKMKKFRKRVAERLAQNIQDGFNGAIVDDLINDGPRFAHVNVTYDNKENISVVIANGEDAVWVEFGAGVYYNGPSGTSPHPNGNNLGFTIGGYGQGKGSRKIWGFYEDGQLRLTRGTPATMPMYNTVRDICKEITKIAREIFV